MNKSAQNLPEKKKGLRAPKARILVVDDNDMTAMILQNAIESFGAEADIVNGGESAL